MEKFSNEMNEFLAEYNKAVAAIIKMGDLAETSQEVREKLIAEGCYDESYYNEFNALEYVVRQFEHMYD